jgi:hypothetical protein
MENMSIKEVTNDLVGYWGLDDVATSDFPTKYLPDSLGGELGSELFTGWENNAISYRTHYAGWPTFSSTGESVTASVPDEGDGGGNYSKVFNTNTFSVVAGTAYEINMTVDSKANTYGRGMQTYTNTESGYVVYDLFWRQIIDGANKIVLLANTTSSTARFGIRAQGGTTASVTISAMSIKPLTGNYGRLL